jgi:hypothetical protein
LLSVLGNKRPNRIEHALSAAAVKRGEALAVPQRLHFQDFLEPRRQLVRRQCRRQADKHTKPDYAALGGSINKYTTSPDFTARYKKWRKSLVVLKRSLFGAEQAGWAILARGTRLNLPERKYCSGPVGA